MYSTAIQSIGLALAVLILGGAMWLFAQYSERGGCYEEGSISGDPRCIKSIAQLMANPEEFDGKIVSIRGEFGFPFEGSYIKDLSYERSIWLSATYEIMTEFGGTCYSVGLLQGVFRKGPTGHLLMSEAGFHATDILEIDTTYRKKCGM